MKTMKLALAVAAMAFGGSALAQSAEGLTCDNFRDRLGVEPTAEALERFRDLQGSCEKVVERDGELFVMTRAVVRRPGNRAVRLYIPATDRTISVEADPNRRFELRGGNNVRARDLNRGQELNIYINVARFTEPVITEMAFTEEVEEVPVEVVAALPTTG